MSHELTVLAPLGGWSAPLSEVPDEVFAQALAGEGVAIDPTSSTLCAPCSGEVVHLPASRHAVTLRAACGAQILMHVGIDTVALAGEGFQAHVAAGDQVAAGARLLSFDMDLIARRGLSLLTPIVLAPGSGFVIEHRTVGRAVSAGETLMQLSGRGPAHAAVAAGAPGRVHERTVRVQLEHGIHARPAAQIVSAVKSLDASVQLHVHGRDADATSTLALMTLGVRAGDAVQLRARGADAGQALARLGAILTSPAPQPAQAARVAAALPAARRVPASNELQGVTASPGVACGIALQLRRTEAAVTEAGAGITQERAALEGARASVAARLAHRARTAGVAQDIAAAHRELLQDPQLLERAEALIAAGTSAGFAWRAAVTQDVARLRGLPDERLRERAADLEDLESQVLQALTGADAPRAPELPQGAVVIARELLPSQFLALDAARIAGVCTAQGGPTSHVAILAAALGVPMLVALGERALGIPDGRTLVIDASAGILEVDPAPERIAAARAALDTQRQRAGALAAAARQPAHTADGTRVEVFANIGALEEVSVAVRNGAEGCGLLRTEILFLERATAPDETEQRALYQRIADALGPRPLTIRTLDAGGDKPIAYLPLPKEDNPALGLRGLRTGLAYPQLLRSQLRAILGVTAAVPCRVLLPMISDVAELETVRAEISQLMQPMKRAGASRSASWSKPRPPHSSPRTSRRWRTSSPLVPTI